MEVKIACGLPENNCLYIFCDRRNRMELNDTILTMLMSHVDAALRRLECIRPEENEQLDNTDVVRENREIQ